MKKFRQNIKTSHGGGGGGGADDGSIGPTTGLVPLEAPSGSFVTDFLGAIGGSMGIVSPGNDSGNAAAAVGGPGGPLVGGGVVGSREGGGRGRGGGRGGGHGGRPSNLTHRPYIAESGDPGHISVQRHNQFHCEQEARQLLMRAQASEKARAYDLHQLYTFLNNFGASPKPNQNIIEQVLGFCNDLLSDRDAAMDQMRKVQREHSEAIVEAKALRGSIKDANSRIATARNDADQYLNKYNDTKDKLDKADGKRKDAVAKVMRDISKLTLKHEMEKDQEQAQLRQHITQLESDMAALVSKHEIDKAKIDGDHQVQLAALEERHEEALKQQDVEKERIIDEIIDSHDAELQVYNSKVRELASDLISQSDDFRPATDQGLSMKLLDLRNRIKNITVPNNLQIRTASVPALSGADGTAGGLDGGGAADTAGTAAGIHQLPADLDPTDFVARHGSRDIQYILRSLVWKALIEAFFSAPFGFGFLGSDASSSQGRQQLLEIHRSWSRLYEGGYHQHPYRGDELSMYSHDPYANKMRSALFQSFLPAVYPDKASRNNSKNSTNSSQQDLHQGLYQQLLPQHPLQPTVPEEVHPNRHDPSDPSNPMWPSQYQFQSGDGSAAPPAPPPRRVFGSFMSITSIGSNSTAVSSSNGAGGSASHGADVGVAMLYRQHCDSVILRIRQLLDRITNNNTRPDALEAVPTIVNLAAELGLECGVQRAQIWLLIPKPNDIVTVGAEYADCLGAGSGDGDSSRGRDVKVDIVVSPGIVRIGDGRRDMTVRKILVPCEVFPFMEDGN